MQIIHYPERKDWNSILARPQMDNALLMDSVSAILEDIRANGDRAVKEYTHRFDQVQLDTLGVSGEEIEEAIRNTPRELKEAIQVAKENIEQFHRSQAQVHINKVETTPGVYCWQKAVAIRKVGLYIPGGSAPLFSTVLMLAVPAQIAGCQEIVLCTPANREGKIHPAILYAAHVAGVKKIFKIGGAQAIGAMAYGTESVPKVYKLFGPGNQYVTAAKQLVSLREVAIDMPAGPSEVAVMADDTANPAFVAADLLSQAEHGTDSQAILLTTSEALLRAVVKEVERQVDLLPRKELALQSLAHSKLILLKDMETMLEMSNEYAPEHLIIETKDYLDVAASVVNAGSVFLGSYSPESAGDYASGTNHTLPTNGYAKAYSGVNLDSFVKKITFQEITREGLLSLGPVIEIMAEAEELVAHKRAVTVRTSPLSPPPNPLPRRGDSNSLMSKESDVALRNSPSLGGGWGEVTERLGGGAVRSNIAALHPYSCARDEFQGEASVYLDANESPYNAPYNRYPDPLQRELKAEIAQIKKVRPGQIMLGNGSDEPIDLAIRIFCEPGEDNVVAIDPSYGMYQVCCDINNVTYRKVKLDTGFRLNSQALLDACDERTKIIFLCSPNNPSGNLLCREEVRRVLNGFPGIVVVDEAYIDFAPEASWLNELDNHPNLVVLQTFSKAWGLASIRCGMAFASEEIIAYFNKVKYPYNMNKLTQDFLLQEIRKEAQQKTWVGRILQERDRLKEALNRLPFVQEVYPSDANFFLVRMEDANRTYTDLVNRGIIVRNRHRITLCDNCLRITVGTQQENDELINALTALYPAQP